MRSSRRHHRVVFVSATVIVAITAAACTSDATPATSPHTPAGGASGLAARITANPPPATTTYYLVPNRPRRADGTVYERALHSRLRAGHALGRGTDLQVTPSAAPGAVGTVQWFSSRTGRETLMAPGEPAATMQEHPMPRGESGDQALCALAFDGRYYRQRGHDVVAISGHRIVARYRLPALRPERWAVRTGIARRTERPAVGMVGALVPMRSGHVVAFTFTGVAAAVTDLMTGRSTSIPDSGDVESAVRTASGAIYVVVDRLTDRGIDIEGWTSPDVVWLDPATFRILARMRTGAPRHHFRIATLLPGVGHAAVLTVLATGDAITNPALRVWTVDGNRLTTVRAISSDLSLAPDDAHHIFVYNAKRVGVLDIATGAYRPNVRRLDPPPGSAIEAIV